MLFTFRSSRRDVSGKKGVLRNFAKFTGKHLCYSLIFNKVAGLKALSQVFFCEFWEVSKNTFLHRTPLVAASVRFTEAITLNCCRFVLKGLRRGIDQFFKIQTYGILSLSYHFEKEIYQYVNINQLAKKKHTAQKMKFSIKDFFSRCDRKLRIWSHLLKKSFRSLSTLWSKIKIH